MVADLVAPVLLLAAVAGALALLLIWAAHRYLVSNEALQRSVDHMREAGSDIGKVE